MRTRWFFSSRAAAWLLVVVFVFAPACKKRKAVSLDSDDDTPASAPASAEAARAAVSKAPPAGSPPTGLAPGEVLPRSPIVESEPDKAPRPALGFPIPDKLKVVSRASNTEVYQSQASLKALERFYRREMGRDGDIEPRGFGFRVTSRNDPAAFVLVTQHPGQDFARIAVIGAPPPPAPKLPDDSPR